MKIIFAALVLFTVAPAAFAAETLNLSCKSEGSSLSNPADPSEAINIYWTLTTNTSDGGRPQIAVMEYTQQDSDLPTVMDGFAIRIGEVKSSAEKVEVKGENTVSAALGVLNFDLVVLKAGKTAQMTVTVDDTHGEKQEMNFSFTCETP